jgi:RNA polymerase sigma-70 factor (ECF subfamily)
VAGQDERELFAGLAVPLLRPLYNFARWMARDPHDAEDLVQETYARALKSFASFQPGTDFRAWMFRILRNAFLSARRGAKNAAHVSVEEEGEEMLLPATEETPESLLLAGDTRQRIRAALERLPEQYREAILLCDVEEMRYQEIAELLGVPAGTVMSRIARGRKLLRGLLAEEHMRARR